MNDLISVIIPVYNVEEYLRRCLDSIIHNSFSNIEIICVNDGSTDTSLSILEEYAATDARIVIINKDNGGLSSARNAGLRIAKGSYIAFVDSDDWVSDHYFEFLYRAIKEYNSDISICNYTKCIDDFEFKSNPVYKARLSSVYELESSSNKNHVWRKLFKKEIIDGIWFDEKEKIEDYVYNLAILLKNRQLKICYIDSVLYAYYQRCGSLVTKITAVDRLKLSMFVLKKCKKEEDPIFKSILAEESIKLALLSRNVLINFRKKQKIKVADKIIFEALPYLNRHKKIYQVFYKLPISYRIFRIWNDRKIITYEKRNRRI